MATEINTSSPLMMFFSTLTTGACILFGHLVATCIKQMFGLDLEGAIDNGVWVPTNLNMA